MDRSSQFSVALVPTAAELKQTSGIPNVIVFPEGVDRGEILNASNIYTDAVIVGAVREQEGNIVRMRGVVWYKEKNHIDYLKAATDHRTSVGTGNFDQNPVASFSQLGLSIGVLICMDIGDERTSPELRNKVIDSLKSSEHEKLLCIPADMPHNGWFWGDSIDAPFHDVYVALCNQPQMPGEIRTKSFITNTSGKKILQSESEPIFIGLTVNAI